MQIQTVRNLAAGAFVVFVGSTIVHVLALGTPWSRYIGRGTFGVWAASVTVLLVTHCYMGQQLLQPLRSGVVKMAVLVYSLFWLMTATHLITKFWQEYGYFKISGWVAFGVVIVLFVVQQMLLYNIILPQLEKPRAAT